RFDLIHGPNFHAPEAATTAARVATIHDMGYLLLPECHPPGMPERLDALVRTSVPGTRMFLCNSQNTADAFAAEYRVDPDRLAVTPLAVDAAAFAPDSAADDEHQRLAKAYGLDRPYVLFVGAMVPRKDLRTLVAAWALVAREQPELDLVLAGDKAVRWASDWPHVEAWMRENPDLASRVHILDYVPLRDLPVLYRGAAVVMLTSLLEGFGLPVLEGMAAERPVVATRSGALPEVGGDAAYYGAVRDPSSFGAALQAALAAEEWPRRLAESHAIVARHTWLRTAELTLTAYRKAVASPLLSTSLR
ncbi:MAG: glycosyltransferase family 4 protein, partial [Actinomycetota bacterium]|nr:glycosyltransferase family 4 protein [Actinomycetota bacterium]